MPTQSFNCDFKPITYIAKSFGLKEDDLILYGNYKAKIKTTILNKIANNKKGKLIIVTAITPTAYGEGKTVTTIGLTQGLDKLGKKACACIRQPSMGPVFGTKGGAAGGGLSQIVPSNDLNLHLTGDFHSITSAHNLAAAAIDARLFHETRLGPIEFEIQSGLKPLNIDVNKLSWRRVLDQNERSLRNITVGLGDNNGPVHDSGFDITAASELTAILALSHNLLDMRKRIGKIVLALNTNGEIITAEQLGVAGAMTAIMIDAINPTLMQTVSGAPCLIHSGPFANIAHGNSSIIADKIALHLSDYVVTEAGFGSDLGFEKFANIKVRESGNAPDCVVLVVTLKGLKANVIDAIDSDIERPNAELIQAGLANLEWHVKNINQYGAPVVVAINRFPSDTIEEINWLKEQASKLDIYGCEVSEAFSLGADGALDLSKCVMFAAARSDQFNLLYEVDTSLEDKIREFCRKAYGASGIVLSYAAQDKIEEITRLGYSNLPICVAKTPMSISHDPKVKGVPKNFELPIRDLYLNAGAGFITVLTGNVVTMPGLGLNPAYLAVDIDNSGNVIGLS